VSAGGPLSIPSVEAKLDQFAQKALLVRQEAMRCASTIRTVSVLAIVAPLAACATAAPQHQATAPATFAPEQCRSLQAVIEERERYGMLAPNHSLDEEALRQCGLPHSGGEEPQLPQAQTSPPADALGAVFRHFLNQTPAPTYSGTPQLCDQMMRRIANSDASDEVKGMAFMQILAACNGAPVYQAPQPQTPTYPSTTNCYFTAGTMTCFND
jgi:hypothetical protein